MKQTDTNDTVFSLKTEIAKIRSLSPKKRFEYIWEYYRLTVFLIAFGLFFCWMIGSFLINTVSNTLFPKQTFSIAFAASDFSANEQWTQQCLDSIGYDEEQESFQLLTCAPHNDTTDDFRISTSVWLVNGQPDIFIAEDYSCQYLLELEALADLTEVWPTELQQLAADRMVDPWRLDLSGTAFAEAYGLAESQVYLCMYVHGDGFDRALDIVEYILTTE
jgi:hypothetical protein